MSNQSFDTTLPEAFDPETQEGTKFDVVPIGSYVAQITDASVSQPKSGNGWQVNLSWQITEGEYEGRYVFQRVTFMHSSTQATNIGRQQFKDLCVATGVSEALTDVTVFKLIPCRIKVGIEIDKQGIYSDKNKVSRVLPLADQPKPEPAKPAAKPTTVKPEPIKPATTEAAAKPTAKAAATSGNSGAPPPWRKPDKPTTGDVIDDDVPY